MPVGSRSPINPPAAGAKVLIRDEEWLVRSVRGASRDVFAVHVVGTSELVRNKEAIFLSDLDQIEELRPEDTELIQDLTPQFRMSRLYLESLLRHSPPTDDAIYTGHRAAIRRADYQLQPAVKALAQPRPRILMADGVGLGKTIEVGILLSELIQRGRGQRILVVALKSMLGQFQKEMWGRFTIPLVRLDSVGIQRVQSRIPGNMNPFYYFDKAIISIDTLKRDEKYRRYLENSRWDAIVVDECQNVAVRSPTEYSASQRAGLAQLLARTCDALILTSATPHDGRAQSFASLIQLLEPTAIADEDNYTAEEVSDYFIRRFKKDVAHEVQGEFYERKTDLVRLQASAPEEAVFQYLDEARFRTIGRQRQTGMLFATLLLKAFLSSPAACISTIDERLRHKDLQDPEEEDAAHDIAVLERLKSLAVLVEPLEFSKYQALLERLRRLGLTGGGAQTRIVVFSERLATLDFLATHLQDDLELSEDQVVIFHGALDDQSQRTLIDSFGNKASPIRILLASDAASEGLNLHHFCHHMVHFDLPWSLITLEQRNGRIDRFGQTHPPEIAYLLTIPNDPGLAGELRVLDRLIEKEAVAHSTLGDVAWLLALHDAEKEEEHIAAGIEGRKAPEEILPDQPAHDDFMAVLFGKDQSAALRPNVVEPVTLFADDLAFARAACDQSLAAEEAARIEWHEDQSGFTLYPPADLERRYQYLPAELRPERRTDQFTIKLTTDRQRVMQALEDARQAEDGWPEWELFWDQHPVAEWLSDRVLGSFGRHAAPVLAMARGVDQPLFIFQGTLSNRRGQPVLVQWFAIPVNDAGQALAPMALQTILAAVGLRDQVANPGQPVSAAVLKKLNDDRAQAVEAARQFMLKERRERASALAEPLRQGLRRLKRWQDASLARVEEALERLGPGGNAPQRRLLERAGDDVKKLFGEREAWINEGIRTSEAPYLRLAAVLVPGERR